MNKKWIHHEGKKWVNEGIVTEEQAQRIAALYPEESNKKITGLLPLFGSLLIGLSILSFIASNWDGITPLFRLLIIALILVGFYTAGERYLAKGQKSLGNSLIILGIISFGAGIILLGQTFNLISYDARLFVLWSLAALYYLYREKQRIFYLVALVLIGYGQFNSFSEFNSFSYVLFILFAAGIGWYTYKANISAYNWIFSFGFSLQALLFFIDMDWNLFWLLLFFTGVYALFDLVENHPWKRPFQQTAVITGLIFAYFLYFTLTNNWNDNLSYPNEILYLLLFIAASGLSVYGKRRNGNMLVIWELLIFVPLFLLTAALSQFVTGIVYLVMLFIFSGLMLEYAYKTENRRRMNAGIFLFLVVTLMAYFNLAWAFLPKSLFFLIGGLLLFGLNAILQRKKKEMLNGGGK
ncbi:DUF2157 domain-containing protein [Fictibacillus aquaticus]|uniref:DUF2157 domain-containing protein n=1 Tax=Fictibacillus aquaticus TaxID=2021314 RepID=UPI0013FD2A33|nr:DUF2157 domain-containing protein [Fictibacillus aquaticus]